MLIDVVLFRLGVEDVIVSALDVSIGVDGYCFLIRGYLNGGYRIACGLVLVMLLLIFAVIEEGSDSDENSDGFHGHQSILVYGLLFYFNFINFICFKLKHQALK